MTERPILMSGPTVKAILRGDKTQTRRQIKPQPQEVGFGQGCEAAPYCTGSKWPLAYYEMRGACWNSSEALRCPFGVPGDRLWVRETWRFSGEHHHPNHRSIYWRADRDDWLPGRWRPSIHMPRWASRITLEVLDVRAQRVQDISYEDIRAEGVTAAGSKWDEPGIDNEEAYCRALRGAFADLWDSIHGPGAFSRNDWVRAVTFRRVEGEPRP